MHKIWTVFYSQYLFYSLFEFKMDITLCNHCNTYRSPTNLKPRKKPKASLELKWLREIRRYQKMVEYLIPRLPFKDWFARYVWKCTRWVIFVGRRRRWGYCRRFRNLFLWLSLKIQICVPFTPIESQLCPGICSWLEEYLMKVDFMIQVISEDTTNNFLLYQIFANYFINQLNIWPLNYFIKY